MRSRFDTSFPQPRKMLPLIVFGCDFRRTGERQGAQGASSEIAVCKTCGRAGLEGDAVTCKLAETWALGRKHFGGNWHAPQGDDYV